VLTAQLLLSLNSASFFLISRPKVLLLHLKRFDNTLGKNTLRVFFPATLIKEAIPAEDNESKLPSSDYSLMSVIHHIGSSPGSGHYTADALRSVGDGMDETERVWINFNDTNATYQKTRKITEDSVRQQTAYLLLYSRVDDLLH
jgi:ubiquitin C-terminal hydrolase